ncbi:diguanylate cyclase [Planococcus antarcticus DSM 14505]|uniref:Diguanylate cyclase n=1 Tax=Planococcus antarcticus DSM 14505 TaxID=1185653 RepID=A0ABN4RIT0_9BACL|nr:diguanylate cyclase [Planococcus antarcticus DSM 14505]
MHGRLNIIRLSSIVEFISYLKKNQRAIFEESKKDGEVKELMLHENFQTAFQPILTLAEGETIGFEVLNRPNSTPVFPTTEEFYTFIGKSNNVFRIEGFLRNLSLKKYAEQLKQTSSHENGLIFLNIQPQVLTDRSYRSGTTLDLLKKYNLSPDQVVLELTEKEAVIDYKEFEKTIENYRQQGFRIAVDDAGTGYNSLKTIISLKPEFIKLDKSLIRDIHIQPAQQQLVGLLLDFAAQSNTKIIAEGIENALELRFLKNLGIHFGQGYALGRPEPALIRGEVPSC